MTDKPAAGHDLAIQALRAARAAARQRPTKPKKPVRPVPRGDGRDPIGLGSIVKQLGEAHDWKTSITGGDLIARWPQLCPSELADKVTPVRYDAATGKLHLRPVSHTYATQLRLLGGRLAKHLNDKLGEEAIRAIVVLTPGGDQTTARPAPVVSRPPTPAVEEQPVEPLPPHPAYQAALEAIHAAQHTTTDRDREDQALRDRYFAGHRDTLREPAPAFTDAVTALEETTVDTTTPDPDAVRRAAINRARHEKTGRTPAVPRAFGGAA